MPNSPRLGLDSESYAQIIINSNDNASGVLELSPTTLTVNESVGVPQIRVVRSGGMHGEVSKTILTFKLKFKYFLCLPQSH